MSFVEAIILRRTKVSKTVITHHFLYNKDSAYTMLKKLKNIEKYGSTIWVIM